MILDELHSLVTSKRGHLLALGLARLRRFVPGLQTIGLSATVAEPDELRRWLVGQNPPGDMAELITVDGRRQAGHLHPRFRGARALGRPTSRYAIPEIYEAIRRTGRRCSSSTRAARRRCCSRSSGASTRTICRSRCITARSTSASAGASRRRWRATACAPSSPPRRSTSASTGATSTSSSMSARRRAPAGWRSASAAPTTAWTSRRRRILVPANRFEVLECRAALDANYLGAQDTPPLVDGALDVLAQHVLGMACAEPFDADELYDEVTQRRALCRRSTARPSTASSISSRPAAMRCGPTSATPSIRQTKDGLWRVANPRVAQQYRLNVGTIVEVPMLNVRYVRAGQGRGRRAAGRCSARSRSISWRRWRTATPSCSPARCCASRASARTSASSPTRTGDDAKVPIYAGGKFPLSTYLAEQVRGMLADPDALEGAARAGARLAAAAAGEVGAAEAATSCWSRPFRAATASTWSPIPSRAGWRTRRSACC